MAWVTNQGNLWILEVWLINCNDLVGNVIAGIVMHQFLPSLLSNNVPLFLDVCWIPKENDREYKFAGKSILVWLLTSSCSADGLQRAVQLTLAELLPRVYSTMRSIKASSNSCLSLAYIFCYWLYWVEGVWHFSPSISFCFASLAVKSFISR